jgi:hypothetical protein
MLTTSASQLSYKSHQNSTASGEVLYQEDMENYSIHQSDEPKATELPFRPSDGAEPSWNPLEHRVPRYDPGYASFGPPSPSDSLHNETPVSSPEDSKSRSSERKKTRTSKLVKSVKGKARSTLGWEHTVVRKDGLAQLLEYTREEASPKRFGCRKGELPPETKEKVRRVRKLGACWTCWVLKVPVSHHTTWIIWSRSSDLQSLDC